MIKSLLSTFTVASLSILPASAAPLSGSYTPPKDKTTANSLVQGFIGGNTAPMLSFASTSTPYGTFACLQRAQNKMYQIGATGISNGTGSAQSVFGRYGAATIAVWCRGGEALVMVAGDNSTSLRDEIRSAF